MQSFVVVTSIAIVDAVFALFLARLAKRLLAFVTTVTTTLIGVGVDENVQSQQGSECSAQRMPRDVNRIVVGKSLVDEFF